MPTKNKRKSKYPAYSHARQQALELQLNSRQQYIDWHTTSKCQYLPRYPERVYPKDWVSWNDWLGTANVFKGELYNQKPMRSFWEAVKWSQEFCGVMELDTMASWLAYFKANPSELPHDIPLRPDQCQAYVTTWPQIGWKGWTGGSVDKVLATAKVSTALLCLCSFRGLTKPGNVYAIINAEKGEVELSQVLVAQRQLVPVRVYKMLNADKDAVIELIGKFGRREADGWFIPRVNDLLFELDMALARHAIPHLDYPSQAVSEDEISEMMFSQPGVYGQKVG